MSERLQMATKLKGLHARWCELTRDLGASRTGDNGDRIVRELESIEHEVRTAAVDAAKIMQSDEKEIANLRARVSECKLAHEGSEAVIHMAIARLGGLVEGRPTHRGNFLQRIDELVAMESRIVGMYDGENWR